jgi:cytochrome P450
MATAESPLDAPDLPFFDVNDLAFSIRAEPVKAAREAGPYARTPYGLAVLRYEEVNRLVNDKRLIQGSARWAEHNGIVGDWGRWWANIVLNKEGAEPVRLRKLVNPAFSSRHVDGLVPKFQELANELIDSFIDEGQCEFITQFSEPYATRVICRLLGVTDENWAELAEYSAEMGLALSISGREHLDEIQHGLDKMGEYADELIARRRHEPHDDFLQSLVDANEDGDRLSDLELRDTVILLFQGGIETTRNQLGIGMDLFIRHPDQWDLLGRQPELAANAVEEIMRVRPTTTWVTREAAEDCDIDGIFVPRGTTVHLFTESSGTDTRTYPDPSFDIQQIDRPKHFAFGGGRHYCLGHFIARGDMTEALALLAQRLPGLRYAEEPTWLPDSGNTGPVRQVLTWDREAAR